MPYFVEGLTNFHSGESNVRRIGVYATLKEAIRASEQVIEDFLLANHQYGMSIADLFTRYQKSGEVPFIFSDGERTINVTGFNHFNYALVRCGALCIEVKREMTE